MWRTHLFSEQGQIELFWQVSYLQILIRMCSYKCRRKYLISKTDRSVFSTLNNEYQTCESPSKKGPCQWLLALSLWMLCPNSLLTMLVADLTYHHAILTFRTAALFAFNCNCNCQTLEASSFKTQWPIEMFLRLGRVKLVLLITKQMFQTLVND